MRLARIKLVIILLIAVKGLYSQAPPIEANYSGFVNDFSKPSTLSKQEIDALNAKLLAYEDSTSTQIAVIIENSLNGRDILERALQYARGYQVGQQGKNNGIVLYIAKEDRKYHILNANKTQGRITDGITGQIGRDYLVPAFRANNYYMGINDATTAIMKALAGEFTNDAEQAPQQIPFWVILLVIFIILIFLSNINNGGNQRGYRRGGTYWFPSPGAWPSSGNWGGGGSNWGGGGSSWGGFGGGGGFDGGGAGGSW